jgi:hypothetical protein
MEKNIENKGINKEEIKKQVKEILQKFSNSLDLLEKQKSATKDDEAIECIGRQEQSRKENQKEKLDSEFRKIMFKNSPNSEGDLIFGEKKKW